jgi:hypothetical protein
LPFEQFEESILLENANRQTIDSVGNSVQECAMNQSTQVTAGQSPIVERKLDLAWMKKTFGEPVLVGHEKMEDFDDYANSMLYDLAPTNAVVAGLTWQFIVQSFCRMRLMRLQSRAVQAQILRSRPTNKIADKDADDEAAAALANKVKTFAGIDYLISEATKRETALLHQISYFKLAIAQSLARNLELQEKQIDLEERKVRLRKEEELQEFMRKRELERGEKEAEERTKGTGGPPQSNKDRSWRRG